MKIQITSLPYFNTPAPKKQKKVFDWFWRNFFKFRFEKIYNSIDSVDIQIQQALPWTNLHFYITINNDVENMIHCYCPPGIDLDEHQYNQLSRNSQSAKPWSDFVKECPYIWSRKYGLSSLI